jgi:hypothetical protein
MMNRTCFACGEPKEKKELGFEPTTLKTYCLNPYECTHPNEIPPRLHKKLEDAISSAPGAENMLNKSVSFRLTSFPYLAVHLANMMEEEELPTVNEALIHLINKDYSQTEKTHSPEEEIMFGSPIPDAENIVWEYKENSFGQNKLVSIEAEPEPEEERDPITNPEPLPEPEELEDNMNDAKEEQEDDEWEI